MTTTGVYTLYGLAAFPRNLRVEYRDLSGNAKLQLEWTPPGAGTSVIVPSSVLSPPYRLETSTRVGDTSGATTSTVSSGYTDPALGLATSSTVDPAGLALTTTTGFEPAGTGYYRRVARTLPAGAGSTVRTLYYGDTEAPISGSGCGGVGSNMGGLPKQVTQADPDGAGQQTPVVRQFVYDSAGRVVGSRVSNTIASAPWTCTTFDTLGRPKTVVYPANAAAAARTVTYNYSVGGDFLKSSVADPAGTITTSVDLLGQVRSYTDVWAKTTSYTYDQWFRRASTTLPGGYPVGYGYNVSDQLEWLSIQGWVLADPTYDSVGRMTSVAYPGGSGNAGNWTSGTFGYNTDYGYQSSVTWRQPDSTVLTQSQVASRRIADGKILGLYSDTTATTGVQRTFSYDGAGRLTSAVAVVSPGGAASWSKMYNYTATGCGVAGLSGKNSNRVSQTTTLGVGAPSTVNVCVDNADRVTSITGAGVGSFGYDVRGNATAVGSETHAYDSADRHVSSTQGATTVAYTRDATERITERKVNGVTTARYSFGGSGDSPAVTLNASNVITEFTFSLPGGV